MSILLCANASGDCKIRPIVIYHSENTIIHKKNKVMKSKLPVMWQSNPKSWCTRNFFVEWVFEEFGLRVKEYLKEKHLPLKCLLVMNNVTAQPQDLDDDVPDGFDFINVKFQRPNTTPLLHPITPHISLPFLRPTPSHRGQSGM